MTKVYSGPQWTEAQKKTIEERNKNILVSAAAGSGKTAVLVERIKKLIIDGKQDISGFLITTFTKAAAEEMKQRLEKSIRAELAGARGDDRVFLTKQLYQLPAANISTFHSFAIEVIRQYFYLIDLEPGFRIGDEIQMKLIEKEAIDDVFERRFEEGSGDFKGFLKRHSSDRNDKKIKESLIGTYNALRSIPDYMSWAESKVEEMGGDYQIPSDDILKIIIQTSADFIDEAAQLYSDAVRILDKPETETICGKAAYNAKLLQQRAEDIYADLSSGRELKNIYEETGQFIRQPGFMKLTSTKDEKPAYELVKDQVQASTRSSKNKTDDLKKKYYLRSLEEYAEEMKASYEDTKYYLGLIREFEEVFMSKKKDEGCIDFNDVMHLAINILEDDRAADELRSRFEYIFVDEYQDSNALQERIIGRIARENNLFMVGDVKQSIYKFRLAEPELFMDRDAEYRKGADETSIVIDLNKNFRSKSRITQAVNKVFSANMEGYSEEAALHCTIEENSGYGTNLNIIQGEGEEAELIARLIRGCIGTDFYDSKKKAFRKIEYRDIAVLSRSKAPIAEIERYLNNEGIPAYGETGEGYFETVELQLFVNVLKVINNMMQDIPLISVMRSVLFGFTTRELAQIRIDFRKGSYAQALIKYLDEGGDQKLQNKISQMIRQIEIWKAISISVPLDELIRTLIYDTGFYDYFSGLPAGGRRTANLRMLIEKAAAFEASNQGGLYSFLTYIDAMASNRMSEAEAKSISENDDVVRVMTVHKSKGLEFPVVILAGAGKSISGGGRVLPIHKDLGLGLKLVDRKNHWFKRTLLQKVISDRQRIENIEEEVRILYVAMTRAMDRLEVIGRVDDICQLKTRPAKTSYLDMIYGPLSELEDVKINVVNDLEAESDHIDKVNNSIDDLLQEAEAVDYQQNEEIARRLDFRYILKPGSDMKMKYSVSELNSGKKEYPVTIADFAPAKKDGKVTPAQLGTAMHYIMERIDFAKASDTGIGFIDDFADSLAEAELISMEERRAINTDGIAGFFRNETGARAVAADAKGKLHREQEFILSKTIEGNDVIVQGVIDCWFEEEDGIVLIDYKNAFVNEGRNEEEIAALYKEQILLYKEALEGATGRNVKETYLYLFGTGGFVEIL